MMKEKSILHIWEGMRKKQENCKKKGVQGYPPSVLKKIVMVSPTPWVVPIQGFTVLLGCRRSCSMWSWITTLALAMTGR